MGSLDGQIAVVSGAARGIGEAIAARLARSGAAVALCDVRHDEVERTADRFRSEGLNAIDLAVDVGDHASCQEAAVAIGRALGPVSILVNNAGINRDARFLNLKESDWDDVLRVNLKGAFNMGQAFVPTMIERRYGKIVNISSRVYLGNFGQANYAASKAGIVGLTRTMALELARYNVNVNAIAPGFIETPMTAAMPTYARERAIAAIPLGRTGTPDDVAKLAAFLVSDDSSYITGQVILICGGRSISASPA